MPLPIREKVSDLLSQLQGRLSQIAREKGKFFSAVTGLNTEIFYWRQKAELLSDKAYIEGVKKLVEAAKQMGGVSEPTAAGFLEQLAQLKHQIMAKAPLSAPDSPLRTSDPVTRGKSGGNEPEPRVANSLYAPPRPR